MLVLINPFAGLGRAQSIWLQEIQPRLLDAGWKENEIEVLETSREGDVQALIETKKERLKRDWTIMTLGGDGLIHQVIAAILSQLPLVAESRIRIVPIPCGSGNALCQSLGIGDTEAALHRFLENETRSLKVSGVYVKKLAGAPTQLIRPCFCVFSWGYHAQIVKQSESLRFLGLWRFKLAAIWNLVRFFPYYCNFRTLSDSSMKPRIFKYFLATKMTHLQKGFKIAPMADFSSSIMTLITTENVSRLQMAKFLKAVQDGNPVNEQLFPFVQTLNAEGFVLRPDPRSGRWRGWLDWTKVHDICIDGEMEEIENRAEIWVKPLETASQIFVV